MVHRSLVIGVSSSRWRVGHTAAIKLAGVAPNDVTVVKYKREPNLASLLMGSQAKSPPLDLAKILDLTAPRAYYLCTWLPPLASSADP